MMRQPSDYLLEDELFKLAGHLSPLGKIEMAQKLGRWARQLRTSARVQNIEETHVKNSVRKSGRLLASGAGRN